MPRLPFPILFSSSSPPYLPVGRNLRPTPVRLPNVFSPLLTVVLKPSLGAGLVRSPAGTALETVRRFSQSLAGLVGVPRPSSLAPRESRHELLAWPSVASLQSFPRLVSAAPLASPTRQPFDSAKVRFDGGAAAITDALASHVRAKGVNVLLDCTVDHISTAHDDAVQLDGVQAGERRSWKAGAVFLAIPPRLALPPVITWEPSLPAQVMRAAKNTPTWMAQTTKVLVTYPRPFWRDLGMSGNAMSSGGGGPIQQLYDSSGPDGGEGPHALCGFVFGSGAREPPGDDVLRPQVLQQLTRMFGADAGSPLTFSSHRWGQQPLTSANGGGAGGGHDSMGHPELRVPFGSATSGGHPRVWLSAAETDGDHAGLMEGAVLAGRRVVEQALRGGAIKRQEAEAAEGTCAKGFSSS